MKTNKKKSQKAGLAGLLHSRSKKLWLILLLLIVSVGWFGYQKAAIYQDKQRFAQAEDHAKHVFQKIESQVGTPKQQEVTKTCDYINQKNSQGPLSCRVAFYLNYSAGSSRGNAERIVEIEEAVKSFVQETTSERGLIQWQAPEGELSCYLSFSKTPFFGSMYYWSQNEDSNTDKGIYVSLVCSGAAKAPHYQLTE